MKFSPFLFFSVLIAVSLTSCRSRTASLLPEETTKYSIESTEKFAVLDRVAQAAITCTGLQEQLNQAGRLEVVANLKNRENVAVEVQVRCVFKDANGFTTRDETAWQTVALAEEETKAVRFTATNLLAKKYTLVVRSLP